MGGGREGGRVHGKSFAASLGRTGQELGLISKRLIEVFLY